MASFSVLRMSVAVRPLVVVTPSCFLMYVDAFV